MNCLNCGTTYSCGCKKRTASDGKSVCANCVTSYEKKLSLSKQAETPTFPPRNLKK